MYQFTGGAGGHQQNPPVTHATQYSNHGQQQSFLASPTYGQYPIHQPHQSPWDAHVAAPQASAPPIQGYPSNQQPPPQNQGYRLNQQHQPQQYSNYSQNQKRPSPQYGSYPSNPPPPYGGYNAGPTSQPQPQYSPYATSRTPYPPQNLNTPHEQQVIPSVPSALASRSNENCYNCGAPGHFAQTCPEPRRAVPVGQLNRGRPFKKQKTYGGAAPSYPSGPIQSHPNMQRGWTHPPTNQSSFSTQQTYPIPSPASTNSQHAWSQQLPQHTPATSSGPHPWSHQESPQTIVKADSQNPWNQPRYPQSSISTNTQRPWNQQQSPQSFHAAPETVDTNALSPWSQQQRLNAGFPQIQDRRSPHQALPTPAPSSNDSQIPSPATSTLNNYHDQYAQQTPSSCADPVFPRHDSITPLDETSQAEPQAVQQTSDEPVNKKAEIPVKLVPDLSIHLETTKDGIPEVETWLEELQALDYPEESAPSDVSVSDLSKFVHDMNEPDYLSNVQDRPQWAKMKDDPIFAKIKANTPTVTFDELILRRNELIAPIDFPAQESQVADDVDQAEESEEILLSREQEERLAALGVSGFAKPVKTSARRVFSAPTAGEPLGHFDSRSPASQDRSGSNSNLTGTPSPADTQTAMTAAYVPEVKNHDFDRISHQPSPQRNGHPTYPPYGASNTLNGDTGSFDHSSPQQPHFEHSQSLKSSPNEVTNNFTTSGHSYHSNDPKWRLQNSPDSVSPSDSHTLSRKRSYRETSEKSDGKARRQEEEAIDRRKHPKVAAAYGRRW